MSAYADQVLFLGEDGVPAIGPAQEVDRLGLSVWSENEWKPDYGKGWTAEDRLRAEESRRLHEAERGRGSVSGRRFEIEPGKYHAKAGARLGKAHMHVYGDGTGVYVNSRGEQKTLTAKQVVRQHEHGMNHRAGDADEVTRTEVEQAGILARQGALPPDVKDALDKLTGSQTWESGRMSTKQLSTKGAPGWVAGRDLASRQYTQADLVAAVRANGVEEPIAIRHDPDGVVVANGLHRLMAAKEAGVADVPVIVQHTSVDPGILRLKGRKPAKYEDWYAAATKEPATELPAPVAAPLTGVDLWHSGEGELSEGSYTPQERRAAMKIWYHDNWTNQVLRGTLAARSRTIPDPKASPARQAELQASIDADWEASKQKAAREVAAKSPIFTSLIHRSPAFTRPALMFRGVTEAEKFFGPVGSMVGKDVVDKGYQSLAVSEAGSHAFGGFGLETGLVRVHLPVGTHALKAIAKGGTDLGEFTLPPGAKMKVLSDKVETIQEWGGAPDDPPRTAMRMRDVAHRVIDVEVDPASTSAPTRPDVPVLPGDRGAVSLAPRAAALDRDLASHLTAAIESPSVNASLPVVAAVRSELEKVPLPAGLSLSHVALLGQGDKATLHVKFRDESTHEPVAVDMKRTIHPLDDGFEVEHDHLYLDKSLQGKGLGSVLNRAMEEVYRKVGVKTVKVDASSTPGPGAGSYSSGKMNGGYTWARAGFDWDPEKNVENGAAARSILEVISVRARKAGDLELSVEAERLAAVIKANRESPSEWPTPVQIAMLGHIPGAEMWIGKDVTANSSWSWSGVRPVLSTDEVVGT